MLDDALDGTDHTVGRVAHGGTLDPKVTGCLPILLGDAARAAQVFDDAVKGVRHHPRTPRPRARRLRRHPRGVRGARLPETPAQSAVSRRLRAREIDDLDVLENWASDGCSSASAVSPGRTSGSSATTSDWRWAPARTWKRVAPHCDGAFRRHLTGDAAGPGRRRRVLAGRRRRRRAPRRDLACRTSLRPVPQVTIAPTAAAEVAEGAQVYAPGVIDVPEGVERGEFVVCYTPDGAAVCLGNRRRLGSRLRRGRGTGARPGLRSGRFYPTESDTLNSWTAIFCIAGTVG